MLASHVTGRKAICLIAVVALGLPAIAQLHQFKPGFNLFSRDQDIQLGKEAAGQVEKQSEVLDNKELTAYVANIGAKLAAQPQAEKYPYTFKVVNDPTINAFALPGGPAFVHTGLIAAIDNDAQLAGVLAHEITHVALRHGTNQASRANLIQLPALLAGAALGGSGSMLGQLAQAGIGLGANSVLLGFSRTAESQADLVGVQIASQAGYNPIEMARFFQKLEADGGSRGPQFFSDHPNPGNRQKAIEDEIRYLPNRNYLPDSGQLPRMKAIIAKLPPPKKNPAPQTAASSSGSAPDSLSIPASRPSSRMLPYRTRDVTLSYPDNWKAVNASSGSGLTIAPPSGMRSQDGAVGYGVVLNYFQPKQADASLWQATEELVTNLKSSDTKMRSGREAPRQLTIAGKQAMVTMLYTDSVFPGQTEVDRLVTIQHPNGLLFLVFVAPDSEAQYVNRTFDQMLNTLRFGF